MCAQNATPPVSTPASAAIDPTPLKNCIRNQMPRKRIAGTSMISQMMNSGTSASTRECGYSTK